MVSRNNAVTERQFSWNAVKQSPKLETGQVHLWLATPEDMKRMSDLPSLARLLNLKEQQRAASIIDIDKRNLYIGGRVGLRILLNNYTGIDNSHLKLGYGERGKPGLLNVLDQGALEFNYTVSAGYAFYGFAWNRMLGVDLEVFPRTVDARAFAKRIMTQNERALWDAISLQEQNNAMLSCWTRKEAYGKLLGVGIRYRMNQANLFTRLDRDSWVTRVQGLFDNESNYLDSVCGIQVSLPMPGAAALMYECKSDATSEASCMPGLDALLLSKILWNN